MIVMVGDREVEVDEAAMGKQVRAGAAVLDEFRIDWIDVIDFDALDMRQVHTCILGQTWGNYWLGLEDLGKALNVKAGDPVDGTSTWAVEHGFDVPENADDDVAKAEYRVLGWLWENEIASRLISRWTREAWAECPDLADALL